jgi:hypothetical protein
MGQDAVAARYCTYVIQMHAGLCYWMTAAELGHALPTPTLGGSIFQSQEPDDRILKLIEDRLETGADPEHLEPVRQRLAHRLGDLASWYTAVAGSVDVEDWEPLAVRLGDYIGDQVAANALATSLLGHRRLVELGKDQLRKNARDRWWRLAGWYVRRLDEQPERGRTTLSGRPRVESIGPGGDRVIEGDEERSVG